MCYSSTSQCRNPISKQYDNEKGNHIFDGIVSEDALLDAFIRSANIEKGTVFPRFPGVLLRGIYRVMEQPYLREKWRPLSFIAM